MWCKRSFVFGSVLTYIACVSGAPSITIDAGTLHGGTCEGNSSVAFFKGVPFALPPTGNLRFAPPQAYNQTYPNGALNATIPPPACIQFGDEFVEPGPTSEDCLFLDIWAPADCDETGPLPVRVWIYGGSENAGGISDPLYDGCNVPPTGAIMVALNYRVGPLGFLALESAGLSGNQAIQDLLLGIEWVRDNIGAFGGDPNRIVLHGQSAGAENTWTIASLPQAPQLIQASIMESGGGTDILLNNTAQFVGQQYAQTLNCSVSDVACLRKVSTSDLQNAFNTLPTLGASANNALGARGAESVHFAPFVDGKIVPAQPSEKGVRVPSIFGATSQDGALFTLLQFANRPNGPADANATDYEEFITSNFGNFSSEVAEQFPLSLFNSTPFPAFTAISTVFTLATHICEDYRGLNVAVANGVPVWAYNFAHTPSCDWLPQLPQESLQLVGPTHTAEIPFVFGNTKNLPQPNGTCSMTEEEKAISTFLNNVWTSMAANLVPTTNASAWPAYAGPGSNQTFGINILNSTIPGLIDFTSCALFDRVNQAELANATALNNNGSLPFGVSD